MEVHFFVSGFLGDGVLVDQRGLAISHHGRPVTDMTTMLPKRIHKFA